MDIKKNLNKITVEIFSSPGCSKCKQTKEILRKAIRELDDERLQWREVNILEELTYATEIGILSTPAIAINNKLVFSYLPTSKKLKQTLKKLLITSNGG